MIRNVVSSRLEESCIYLQCDCGNELIKVYNYPSTTTCPEIIILDYIGSIIDPKLVKYKYLDMSRSNFIALVNALKRCEKVGPYSCELTWVDRQLVIIKDLNNITKIKLCYFKGLRKRTKLPVWDIHVKNNELCEFNILLEDMQNKMREVDNNVTRNDQ